MDINRVLLIDIVVDKGNHVNEIIENLRKVSFGRKDNDMRDYFFPRSGLVQQEAESPCVRNTLHLAFHGQGSKVDSSASYALFLSNKSTFTSFSIRFSNLSF